MFIDIFGPRAKPCRDCIKFGDTWYCTMNCSPAAPSEERTTALCSLTLNDLLLLRDGVQMVKGEASGMDPETVARCIVMLRRLDDATAKLERKKNAQLPRPR